MKAVELMYLNIFLTGAFTILPVILLWVGIGDYFSSSYTLQNTIDIGGMASSAVNTGTGFENSISLLTLPIQIIQIGLNLITNLITANYGVMVTILNIPTAIWGIYATFHYISIITYLVYLFTGRQVE